MTTYFVSRHPGAVDWARQQGLAVDVWLPHLDVNQVQAGDTVAGTLPIQLAAQVCGRGAWYLHLSLKLPAHLRGIELSARDLLEAGARLEAFQVLLVGHESACTKFLCDDQVPTSGPDSGCLQ